MSRPMQKWAEMELTTLVKRTPKNKQSMRVGLQTPTELRRDQVTLTPINKRRLANAGGGLSRFSLSCEYAMIGLALLHAVAASIDRNDLCMMQESIQKGRRQDLVSQQVSPPREAGIGGQNDRAMLVACRD